MQSDFPTGAEGSGCCRSHFGLWTPRNGKHLRGYLALEEFFRDVYKALGDKIPASTKQFLRGVREEMGDDAPDWLKELF